MSHRFVLVTNSDSAGSCIKLGQYLGTLMPVLPAVCRVHQLNIAMVSVLRLSGMMSALFCAALLLKRRRVLKTLRQQLKGYLAQNLQINFALEPDEEATNQVRSCP